MLRYTFSIPGKVPWLLLARFSIIRPLPDLIRPGTLSIMPHDCSRLSGTSRRMLRRPRTRRCTCMGDCNRSPWRFATPSRGHRYVPWRVSQMSNLLQAPPFSRLSHSFQVSRCCILRCRSTPESIPWIPSKLLLLLMTLRCIYCLFLST